MWTLVLFITLYTSPMGQMPLALGTFETKKSCEDATMVILAQMVKKQPFSVNTQCVYIPQEKKK